MYLSIENSTTGNAIIPGQIVEKEKDIFNENENQEMDDPDFDPMGEDLYAVLDEHEFKFNRSWTIVSMSSYGWYEKSLRQSQNY